MSAKEFRRGLRMGAVPVLVALAIMYAILAPTHDIRARMPHLMLDPLMLAGTLGSLFGVAMVLVALTGPVGRKSAAGAGVSAAVGTGLLEIGAFSTWLPDIHSRWVGWAVLSVLLVGSAVAIIAERRTGNVET